MGDVAVRNPATGELRMVPEEGAQAFTEQTGWHVATPEQREYGAKLLESGGVGQQALAAGETAVRTGTFGLVPGASGWQQRAEIQREEHPYIAGAAQAAGALAPALLTGGAASLVGGAAGLGRTGLAVAGALGEGLVGGTAEEIEQARAETRDVSAGNILLYGLGGEIVGRALPKALAMGAGKVRRAFSAVDEVAGEGLPSALAGAEARSVETEARLARDLPEGPERQAALDRTAKQQYDRMAPEAAEDLDGIIKAAGDMGETSSSAKVVERLKQTMPDDAPAQQNFFTDARKRLDEARRKLREPLEAPHPAANSPINLEGKTLDKLNALPIEDAADHARVEALKENPEFVKTGRVTSNDGAHGITVVDDGGGALVLRDGRHRLVAAQELDRETIWGRLVDGKTDRVIYQGEIPLKKLSGGVPFDEGSPFPGTGAPRKAAQSLADAPGLAGFAKRVDQIVGTGLKRLDQAASAADQFLISRDIKQQLQGVSKKMGLVKAPQDQILHEEMRGVIDESWRAIRDGLADESLFGGAARIERDINSAWSDKILRGLGTTESDLARKVDVDFQTGRTIYEADPSKVRNFLKSDRVDRTITARKLDEVLDGAEDMVRAHEVHGTWDPAKLAEQRQRIARLRQARQFADEIQVAQAAAKDAPRAGAAAAGGAITKGEVADAAAETIAGLFPYGGQIYRLAKRVLAIDKAGRLATKQTARRLAGVTGDAVAGAAPKSGIRRAAEAVAGAAKEEAKASSPALRRALDIIERRRAQAGSVDVGAKARPQLGSWKVGRESVNLNFADDPIARLKEMGASDKLIETVEARLRAAETPLADAPIDPAVHQATAAKNESLWTEGEKAAIDDYQSEGYRDVGAFYREGAAEGAESAKQIQTALDKAVKAGNVTPGTAWRGMDVTEKELEKFSQSATIKSKGVWSAATNPDRAQIFAPGEMGKKRVLFKLEQKTGVPVDASGEEELLLRHGTNFEVVKVSRERYTDGPYARKPGDFMYIDTIELREVPAGAKAKARAKERGIAEVGDGIRGILASPIGITTAVGAAGLAAYPAITALQRFTGEYSGPEESFEAKRKILDAEQVSPEALYEALGASLEDLPKANPQLFQQIAARTAEKVRYCRTNLPPGIQTTMMYPNGTPPSQSAMREFATMWNTVMDPHSVLEDIEAGTATGQQMKHLAASDPDLYEQLHSDVVAEVGANFRSVPLSTKLQLDILFNADGLAGPFFSSKAGDMIGQALKDDQARGPSPVSQEPDVPVDQLSTSAGPGGITAIQNSVTNRGGGA